MGTGNEQQSVIQETTALNFLATSFQRTAVQLSIVLTALVLSGMDARATDAASPAPLTLSGKRFLTLPGAGWKLVWHDEFVGSRLDPKKWSLGLPWIGDDGTNRHHNDQYASAIAADDVTVRDGALHLTTQHRPFSTAPGKNYAYTEGLITTHGKFQATYGYFEIRAQLPAGAGPGTWPAFWMLTEGWPPEMDIIEYWGSDNRIHQGTVTKRPDGSQRWDSFHRDQVSLSGRHTFGLEWGPGYQIYNIDGHINNAIYGGYLPDTPHYLLLNSGIDAHRPPRPGTTFPNDFEVDYVRVYSRPDLPALINGDFEGETLAPWGRWNEAAIVGEGARRGRRALRVDGNAGADPASSAQQTVYGLKPNRRYRLSAYVKTLMQGIARLGAKDYGGVERHTEGISTHEYHKITLEFTTGSSATSAAIYCWAEGAGSAIFDDVSLAAAP